MSQNRHQPVNPVAQRTIRSEQQGFSTHSHNAQQQVATAPVMVPRPRSVMLAQKQSPPAFVPNVAGSGPLRTATGPQVQACKDAAPKAPIEPTVTRHNPYRPVVSPALEQVLPQKFYHQLAPNLYAQQHQQPHVMRNQLPGEKTALDKLLHGGSFVTYHSWDSIRQNSEYEETVLGMPSPLQSMEALNAVLSGKALDDEDEFHDKSKRVVLAPGASTGYGVHLGQFMHTTEFREENFLTLRLLADLSGTTLYKCDFDANNCCRIFLDGAQSYERVLALSKRLRATTYGVLVAHSEAASWDLERVHFGSRVDRMPYHSIPIEAMRTSHEMGAPSYHSTVRGGFRSSPPYQQAHPGQVAAPPQELNTTTQLAVQDAPLERSEEIKEVAPVSPRETMTPSPVPSSAYASDCEPTPVKNSSKKDTTRCPPSDTTHY